MRNYKIGARLGLGFGLMIVLIILMAGASILSAVNSQETEKLTARRVGTNDAVLLWARQVEANANQALAAANISDPAVLSIFQRRMDVSLTKTREYRELVANLLFTPEAQALFQQTQDAEKRYMEPREQAFARMRQGEHEATRTFFRDEMPLLAESYFASIDSLSQFLTTALDQQIIENRAQSERNIMLQIGLASFAVLLGLLFAWVVTRSITRPLAGALRLARDVANKDLEQNIQVNGRDEVADLERALGQMVSGLRETVGEVRHGANTIATAAGQISSGNMDLSSRTEQQSSSLAETAATMEEITSTVRQNADNAQQANSLASAASKTATDGGAIMSELVSTMGEINTKSQQVSDIIGVIDSIAFQTNILALNAAVEAARAGEQGRGFAVVASEVRALAQRSASAAREIKTLIDTSVAATTKGNEQAAQAGSTMQEIVESINRVTDIMGEISAASREQTTGIEEINVAVTQMDDVTRQNASLVDESAAAASSLEEQADALARLVATFKLGNERDGNMPASKHAQIQIAAAPEKVISPPPQLKQQAHAADRAAQPSAVRADHSLALLRPGQTDGKAPPSGLNSRGR